MQEGQNARQQIVERIRQSTSILVALSNSPTVDALAASFALSLMLTKMNKHSTAVFSGVIPPAIQFLEPNKTFESNVDALRDFIISLDKEKADRLRYKVEDDVVRIFITPYKTSISEKDLEFSQGDFNVDLIVALGVEKRDDLDKAIVAHGRILHDATIITVNASNQRSSLGSIDWNDAASSSLCEMLVTLSEAFQQPGILDAQISTALLTGIVAATERFSNPRTSPRVMTMAAQLMAAGANQQLIATNLAKAQELVAAPPSAGTLAKQPASNQPAPMPEEPSKKKEPGELDITHEQKTPQQSPKQQEKPAVATPAPAFNPEPQKSAEAELEAALPAAGGTPGHVFLELKDQLEDAAKKQEGNETVGEDHKAPGSESVNTEELAKEPEHQEEYLSSHGSWKGKRLEPPTLGGTLSATAEEALEDAKKAEDEDRNKTLLTHPEDKQGVPPSKRKNKRERQVQPPVAPAPQSAPVVAPELAPIPEPAPAPAAPPDLPPLPPPPALTQEPPKTLEPAPAPAMEPAAPVLPPLPEPAPIPAPAPTQAPEPSLDNLAASAAEAAAAAQSAPAAVGEIDTARQAVSDALDAAPFNPAHNPLVSSGAQEVPPMPNVPISEPLSQDALQALPPAPTPQIPAPAANDLPPLPPTPPMPPTGDALPPAPSLPGLNQPLPPMAPDASTQSPQTPPSAPADPAQFKIPGA